MRDTKCFSFACNVQHIREKLVTECMDGKWMSDDFVFVYYRQNRNVSPKQLSKRTAEQKITNGFAEFFKMWK